MKKLVIANPFKSLKARDYILWAVSIAVNIVAFGLTGWKDPLTFVSAVVGVTSLILHANGQVVGEIIMVIFAVFYSIVSYLFRYYSEFITYAFMSGPIALMAVFSWLKNPYGKSGQVKVASLTKKKIAVMLTCTAAVTVAFYFILRALNTPNLAVSTLSVTTSFLACYLTFLRSPWYAIAYAANDIILIVLWVLATLEDISYLPMVTCFAMFLVNDIYGFISWCKMKKAQSQNTEEPTCNTEEPACDTEESAYDTEEPVCNEDISEEENQIFKE